MIGAYAGQFVCEGFFDIKMKMWKRVLITRTIAVVPALAITFLPSDQIREYDTNLNILQAIQLPFALFPLLKFVSSPEIMAEFALKKTALRLTQGVAWIMIGLNLYTIFTKKYSLLNWALLFLITVCYFYFLWVVIE